jgi:hypothetical protein
VLGDTPFNLSFPGSFNLCIARTVSCLEQFRDEPVELARGQLADLFEKLLRGTGHGEIVARFRLSYYARMDRKERKLDLRETIEIIDALVKRGFDDAQFRQLHHFNDSLASFRRYCSKVTSFVPGSNNHRLHSELKRKHNA